MTFLKKITKLFQSDTGRDSIFGVTGQGTAAIAGAVFFALAARTINIEQFGLLALSLATSAIIKDIIDPSLNATLIKFLSQGHETAKQITRYVFKIRLLYFGLILGVGFLFANPLSWLIFQRQLPGLMILTIITSAIMSLGAMISGFLQGHRLFFKDSLFVGMQPTIRLAIFLAAWSYGYTGLSELVIINAVAYLLVLVVFAGVIGSEYLSGDIKPITQSQANKFIGPITISTIVGTLTDRVSLFITNYLLGPTQVGILAAVIRLFIPAQQIAGVMNSVFGSRFANFSSKKEAQAYVVKGLFMILPIGLTGIAISVFSEPVLRIMYGPEYASGAVLLRIIAVGFCLFLAQVPFVSKLIFYQNRTDVIMWISVIQFILIMVLNTILINYFGIIGAALASSISMSIVALVYIFTSSKFSIKRS